MHPKNLLFSALLVVAGCGKSWDGDVEPVPVYESRRPRVQPKSGKVWGNDLAQGLGLEPWELCRELGQSDCISEAHRVTLGGVEPEVLGIDEPLEHPSVSAPIAVDRVASAACGARFAADRKPGPDVVFGPVLDADTVAARAVVSRLLIERLLARAATEAEVGALSQDLYDAVAPLSDDAVRDWSVGACVAIATSTEALFY